MPPFEHDVFISYAHIDNTTLQKDQEGWIAMLHRALELRLAQLLGENPRIWRDQKLAGNDRFDEEIHGRLLKAAAIVTVLSPRYVRSDWCTKEITAFGEAAEKAKSEAIGNKSRIFKVVKTPVALDEHPPVARGLLGYEFFELDAAGRPREFVRGFGLEPEPEFWAKLDDLAYDLCQLLSGLRENGGAEAAAEGGESAPADEATTIYLAETTSDLDAERDQLRRELLAHGHRLLPDQPLPLRGAGVADLIASQIEQSSLSIHLVGSTYDIVPEGHDVSLIELQARLAAERSRTAPGFSRLIWIPPDREVSDERQIPVIEALQNDPDLGPGDSVLETSLEELKTEVHDKLRAAAAPVREEPAAAAADEPAIVYLIFDQADIDAVAPLEDHLYDRGLDVLVPLFDGDESVIAEEHWDSLHRCDAVLVYQGTADEAWLRTKLRDLRKAPAGRAAPLRAKAVFLGPPETPQKERYRSREVDEIIRQTAELDPSALTAFLDRLGPEGGGDE